MNNIKHILIILLIFSNIHANEYEKWLKEQTTQYDEYKKNIDKEFSNMLKNDWKQFNTNTIKSTYVKKKPIKLPKLNNIVYIPKEQIIKSPIANVIKIIQEKKPIKEKIKQKKLYPKYGFKNISFKFFNQKINIQYNTKYHFNVNYINNTTLSSSWNKLSRVNTENLRKQINFYVNKYALNDWAKYLLIHKTALQMYKQDANKANILSWYLLTKMNIDVKISYLNNKTYLLAQVEEQLFQMAFLDLNFKRYYVLNPEGRVSLLESIYTYKSNYPNATKKLSFSMDNYVINLQSNIREKKLHFFYKNKKYTINTKYSNDLVNFYKTFPQSQYNLYFNSKKSKLISDSLLFELQNIIKNKTELEAVSILLKFVQNAFTYKTDNEQFSYEKVLFPEESLHYMYNDCEDRSIMFNYLIKSLLGLDTVAIKYSDHLASAVNFTSNVNGDAFSYNNKKFTITDATYIGASIGMSMPQYKDKSFTIIP